MNIFLYDDYRRVIREKIKSEPKKGHGQIQKIAQALNVSQSQVSQILNGSRKLSEIQGLRLSKYFRFSDLETEYFIGLVQLARVDHPEVKNLLQRNLKRISDLSISGSVLDRNMTTLEEADQLKLYSDRQHMAVWLLTSIPGFDTVEKISRHLRIKEPRAIEILNFLTHVGLCEEKNGRYKIGIKRTLVTKGSPMLSRHHMNWRLHAMDILQAAPSESLFYTSPMTVSHADAKIIKDILLRSISAVEQIVGPSQSEKTFCLNIDWFEF
jgi:uncharacterized protein (TIGR02147 family)